MLDGFSISGYRSFGPDEVKIANLSRVNIFIGKNNCGKSNILRFLKHIAGWLRQEGGRGSVLDPDLDFCRDPDAKAVWFSIQTKRGSAGYNQIEMLLEQASPNFARRFGDELWLNYNVAQRGPATPRTPELATYLKTLFNPGQIAAFDRVLDNLGRYSTEQQYNELAKLLYAKAAPTLDVHLVHAFRRVSREGDDKLSGDGLINELRRLQSPAHTGYRDSQDRFQRIRGFVQTALGEPSARLEVPAEPDDIYVIIDDKVLPLASLGTGIHELVIGHSDRQRNLLHRGTRNPLPS